MLRLMNITVTFPDKTKAVDDVSFSLNGGESIALIGENGAGKTSLLLAIVGILELSGGAVELDGVQLNKRTVNELRKRIGLVFQNPDDQLFMPMIFDDVAFGCRNFGLAEDEVALRVRDTLERLNIAHLIGRSSLKLSGGEKRMAAIATVLAMEPDILMLDEPTAFLDPKAKRALIDALNALPMPKLIATHDMAFASKTCNRVLLMKRGRIEAVGSVDMLNDETILL